MKSIAAEDTERLASCIGNAEQHGSRTGDQDKRGSAEQGIRTRGGKEEETTTIAVIHSAIHKATVIASHCHTLHMQHCWGRGVALPSISCFKIRGRS